MVTHPSLRCLLSGDSQCHLNISMFMGLTIENEILKKKKKVSLSTVEAQQIRIGQTQLHFMETCGKPAVTEQKEPFSLS